MASPWGGVGGGGGGGEGGDPGLSVGSVLSMEPLVVAWTPGDTMAVCGMSDDVI